MLAFLPETSPLYCSLPGTTPLCRGRPANRRCQPGSPTRGQVRRPVGEVPPRVRNLPGTQPGDLSCPGDWSSVRGFGQLERWKGSPDRELLPDGYRLAPSLG